jgi:hypothetical protein
MNYATTMPRPSIRWKTCHAGFIDQAEVQHRPPADKSVEIACGSYNNVRSFELAPGVVWLLMGEYTARKR